MFTLVVPPIGIKISICTKGISLFAFDRKGIGGVLFVLSPNTIRGSSLSHFVFSEEAIQLLGLDLVTCYQRLPVNSLVHICLQGHLLLAQSLVKNPL